MKKFAFVFTFIAALSLTIFADVRLPDNMRPKPSPSATPAPKDAQTSLGISVNSSIKQPVLRISRGTLNRLNGLPNATNTSENNAPAGFFNSSSTQSLMSGTFLSLAIIFGGVWFARGKSFTIKQKTVVGVLVGGLLTASALTVSANVAPPPFKGINSSLFSDKMRGHYHGAVDSAKIEIVDNDGEFVDLMVPDNR